MFCNTINSGCNGCKNFVTSTAVTLSGTTLIITIPNNNYLNNSEVCICVAQSLPSGVTADTTVAIQINGNKPTYNLQTKCGHLVYGDQICSRRIYCTRVATDTGVFVYNGKKCLPSTSHIFPSSLPISTTTSSSITNSTSTDSNTTINISK